MQQRGRPTESSTSSGWQERSGYRHFSVGSILRFQLRPLPMYISCFCVSSIPLSLMLRCMLGSPTPETSVLREGPMKEKGTFSRDVHKQRILWGSGLSKLGSGRGWSRGGTFKGLKQRIQIAFFSCIEEARQQRAPCSQYSTTLSLNLPSLATATQK